MSSLLSGIFPNPRDREDFLIAAVVIGLFGFFILNYALSTDEVVDAPIAYVDETDLNTHLVKIEKGETRPEPRRIIIDEDVNRVRPVAVPVPTKKIETREVAVSTDTEALDVAPSNEIETAIFDEAVPKVAVKEAVEEIVIEEEEATSDIYEAEEIAETEAVVEPEPIEIEPEPAIVEEKIAAVEETVAEEFNTRGGDFDCLIIVGAFKVAENADVLIDQLKAEGYGSKKIDNRGFTCVGIPVSCADQTNINSTKTILKEKLKVDPWVMKN